MNKGWIGVDLDGTLVKYEGWQGPTHVGEPVMKMVNRVKLWLAKGIEVRIFTARVSGFVVPEDPTDQDTSKYFEACKAQVAIQQFCLTWFGRTLPVTCQKDYACIQIWDDRAIQVIPDTGDRADGKEDEF